MQEKTTQAQFAALMGTLLTKYPAHRPEADAWRATVKSYHQSLLDFTPVCLSKAFGEAVDESPKFFPSAGSLRGIASRVRSEIRKEEGARKYTNTRGQKLLSAPGKDKAEQFKARVDRGLQEIPLRTKLDDPNARAIVENCLDDLAEVYGLSTKPSDDGFEYNRAMLWIWERKHLSPLQILKGLRGVPRKFKRYPTSGMLEAEIRGERHLVPKEYTR